MKSTTTEKTLRSLFAKYGLPKQIVSDNGPQFTAKEFQECMCANGIKHLRGAPYHPATNGEAERFVQTFKRSLQAGRGDPGTVPQKLAQFLLSYRTTPNTTTGVTPAELFLKRKLRTRLDLLRPSVEEQVREGQQKQKKYHDRHSRRQEYRVGQAVLVKNMRDGPPWLVGRILEQLGPANYEVKVDGQVWKRHADQLMLYKGDSAPDSDSAVSGDIDVQLHPHPVALPMAVPVVVPVATERPGPAVQDEAAAPRGQEMPPVQNPNSSIPSPPRTSAPPILPSVPPTSAPTPSRTPTRTNPKVLPKTYPHRDRNQPNWFRPSFD